MRPRVFPAEDPMPAGVFPDRSCRFNEAAGIPRGRQRVDGQHLAGRPASMRPRVFPAEDAAAPAAGHRRVAASMRPRVFPAEDVAEDSVVGVKNNSLQ